MKASQRKGFIDRESYVAQYLALAVLTIGIASIIGTDDLLAAFSAGQFKSELHAQRSSHLVPE
jgi:sodium/hydrogen antiporter